MKDRNIFALPFGLTERQFQVWSLSAKGLSAFAIAKQLGKTPHYIERILSNEDGIGIYPKLDVTSSHGATALYCHLKYAKPMIELASQNRSNIERYRLQGDLEYAINQAEHLADQIEEVACEFPSESIQKELFKIKAGTLIELQSTYKASCPRDKLYETVIPIAAEVERIAEESGDPELFGLAHYSFGDTLYILGKYEEAVPHLKIALEHLKDLDNRLWALRSLGLSFAYLLKPEEYERVEQMTSAILEAHPHDKLEYVWMAFEGISMSQAILKQTRAYTTLQTAQSLAEVMKNQFKTAPYQEIATICSALVIAKYLGIADKVGIERLGTRGIEVAKNGYPRHEQTLRDLLQAFLD